MGTVKGINKLIKFIKCLNVFNKQTRPQAPDTFKRRNEE